MLKGLDLIMGKVQSDNATKKAYVDFLSAIAPKFAQTAKTYLAYQGMQSELDRQKAELAKPPAP